MLRQTKHRVTSVTPISKIGPEQELHDLVQQGYELQFISVHFRPQTFGWLAVQNLCFDARKQPSKTDYQVFLSASLGYLRSSPTAAKPSLVGN